MNWRPLDYVISALGDRDCVERLLREYVTAFIDLIKDFGLLFKEYGINFSNIEMAIIIDTLHFALNKPFQSSQNLIKLLGLVKPIIILIQDNNFSMQIIQWENPLFLKFSNII